MTHNNIDNNYYSTFDSTTNKYIKGRDHNPMIKPK